MVMAFQRSSSSSSRLSDQISKWQQKVDDHKDKQLINPFSEWDGASHRAALSKDDPNYGRPIEGSKTELRGKQANALINAEIAELCFVIASIGERHPNGVYTVKFGRLFNAYTRISNKLLGILVRARKRGLVEFVGEVLYQRQDENVIITMLRMPDDAETVSSDRYKHIDGGYLG